ncbi:unnamed protein product, partial [Hapterophycus canaliculatus]
SQRSNLTQLLVAALADGAYATAPGRLPGAGAACVAALSAALRRMNERCAPPVVGGDGADRNGTADEKSAGTGGGGCRGKSDGRRAAAQAAPSTAAAAAAVAAIAAASVSDAERGCSSVGGDAPQVAGAATAAAAPPAVVEAAASPTLAAAAPVAAARAAARAARVTPPPAETALPSPSRCRRVQRRKLALARGARAFAAKPREGLKLLQREGVFGQQQQQQEEEEQKPSGGPLDAVEVAAFLRSTPGLDKAAVGGYLGEAGAKRANGRGAGGAGGNGAYQGDTAEFHEEVLEAFVETFDFRGQGMLDSLRMFLEAFRLPGEAQQIDRILHRFAQRVHRDCLEAARGMLASADVAYLLSFSVV